MLGPLNMPFLTLPTGRQAQSTPGRPKARKVKTLIISSSIFAYSLATFAVSGFEEGKRVRTYIWEISFYLIIRFI